MLLESRLGVAWERLQGALRDFWEAGHTLFLYQAAGYSQSIHLVKIYQVVHLYNIFTLPKQGA